MQNLIPRLVTWLTECRIYAHAQGFVLGLSGGVDSAVVAALAHKAQPDSTLGLIMPCDSNPQDALDALACAQSLGLRTRTIDLSSPYKTLLQTLQTDAATPRMALANLKPRLRMLTLYFFANTLNAMVLGTGNKSELEMGYFTKYGDGGADLLPLGGLYKTQVWELAKLLGVPQAIIAKPPSAGLWPDQTDEEEIGFPYAQIDAGLQALENGNPCPDSALMRCLSQKKTLSAHKLQMPLIFQP